VSSGAAGSTARNEWTISASGATPPGGLTSLSSFISDLGATVAPGTVAHPPNLVASMTATVGIPRGQGIIRYGISQPASGKVLFNKDAYPAQSSSGNVTGYSPQGYFRFGNRYDGTTPLANCSLEQVIIYSQALTAAQVEEVGRFNEYGLTPLALWGDSFNNVQQPMEMLRLHYANAGYTYLPMFSDGMGGRGLNFHYEALTEWVNYWPSLKDFLLVMNEGGFDYSSLALDGVTTEGPFSERQIETYINQIYGLFKTQRGVYMEAHTNLAGDGQLTATTTTALTSAWSAAIYSPAALTSYTIKNTGTEPVEYIASATVPTGNGSWLAPGGTATVAVDGTASQKLYAKASRSGDTSSLASYVSPGAYDQLSATLANIKATFPSLYCDVNALLQSQAATDSDYLAFRANGKTPQQLHISTASNEIHISWGTAFSGADSGYYWWALAMLRKLAAIGWVPTKPEAA
jgi:hypothetical protein